jgi:hypothetical protein
MRSCCAELTSACRSAQESAGCETLGVAPEPTESETLGGRYAASGNAALVAAELEALGSDYQANGYTTVAQADELGRLLALSNGQVLLDIGSGCGWPGLYLAARYRCAIVSADPIDEGSGAARQRAIADGLSDRSLAVRAEGARLPIRPGSVDAVVQSDVLC